MTTLQSRLQDELIGDTEPENITATDTTSIRTVSRNDLRAVQRSMTPTVAATIAADLKGTLPKKYDLVKLYGNIPQLSRPGNGFTEKGWREYSERLGHNKAIDEMSAALDRYCSLTKEGE